MQTSPIWKAGLRPPAALVTNIARSSSQYGEQITWDKYCSLSLLLSLHTLFLTFPAVQTAAFEIACPKCTRYSRSHKKHKIEGKNWRGKKWRKKWVQLWGTTFDRPKNGLVQINPGACSPFRCSALSADPQSFFPHSLYLSMYICGSPIQ